jgi:Epoxide hydrolase N terminus
MTIDTAAMSADPAVQPFHVDIAEEAIADLRRRIVAWRPPEREPVDDQSQGVQLATVQGLANYWATEYDWRRCEAKLNALEQFITSIDGLDVHFIHARSSQQNALPLIVSHGWPGSIIEQLKIIEPLTNPAITEAFGRARDARHRCRPTAAKGPIPPR